MWLDLPAPRPRHDLACLAAVVRREMALRHRGAALGFLWPLLDPVLLVGAYAMVLGGLLEVGEAGQATNLAAGLLPWSFLVASWAGCATAFPSSASMLRTLCVEPGLFALAPSLAALPGFVVGVLMLATWTGALAPGLVLVGGLYVTFVLAACVLIAHASLRLPDLASATPAALRLLFFATPVLYPASRLPAWAAEVAWVHPLVPFFQLWRAALVGTGAPGVGAWAASLTWTALAVGAAVTVHRRLGRGVAAAA